MNRIEQINNELNKDITILRNIKYEDEKFSKRDIDTYNYEVERQRIATLYKGIKKKYPEITNFETLSKVLRRLENNHYGYEVLNFKVSKEDKDKIRKCFRFFHEDNDTEALRLMVDYVNKNRGV